MEEDKKEKKELKDEEITKKLTKEVSDKVEEEIKSIIDEGIQESNIKMLGELVDIHKDIANEDYWKKKEEVYKMRYRTGDYGDYSEGYSEGYGTESYGRRGVPGTGRGRYRDSGSYGRRGNYRGQEMIDEMAEHYENYKESSSYNGPESDKAFDYMLQSAEDFFMYLIEEVEKPQQMEKIKKTAKRISEMRM